MPKESCSSRMGFLSMGRNDKSTLFFNASFSTFGTLRRPQGQFSGVSRSLTSLQIMINLWSPQILNLNHQKITYFRHYVPWTKIPDDMNKSKITKKTLKNVLGTPLYALRNLDQTNPQKLPYWCFQNALALLN